MKDGRELKEQAMKYRMTAKGTKLSLDILECTTSDAGQYALIVANKKGADSKAAFSLNVWVGEERRYRFHSLNEWLSLTISYYNSLIINAIVWHTYVA